MFNVYKRNRAFCSIGNRQYRRIMCVLCICIILNTKYFVNTTCTLLCNPKKTKAYRSSYKSVKRMSCLSFNIKFIQIKYL